MVDDADLVFSGRLGTGDDMESCIAGSGKSMSLFSLCSVVDLCNSQDSLNTVARS